MKSDARNSVNHGANAFFFQAEDGIRGYDVTGVQTCALPILCGDDVNPQSKNFFEKAKNLFS